MPPLARRSSLRSWSVAKLQRLLASAKQPQKAGGLSFLGPEYYIRSEQGQKIAVVQSEQEARIRRSTVRLAPPDDRVQAVPQQLLLDARWGGGQGGRRGAACSHSAG